MWLFGTPLFMTMWCHVQLHGHRKPRTPVSLLGIGALGPPLFVQIYSALFAWGTWCQRVEVEFICIGTCIA